jgi:hypothetical protein
MPNGRINTKGRLERGAPQTNRSLLHYSETIARLNAAFYPLKIKPAKVKAKPAVKEVETEPVNPENIVKSIHDTLPLSKFTGSTVAMFKGKTYLYMAKEYPKIMMTFIRERKELVFTTGVLDELIRVAKDESLQNDNE